MLSVRSVWHFDPASLRRELDCVRQQVEHNLPDLSFVSACLPSRSSTLVCRAMPLRPARSRTKLRALSSAVGRVEVRQLQLHPPRFDFREIEDLVDQGQEMGARPSPPRPPHSGCDGAGWNGYLLTVACPCGVTFERWITPAEADADLRRLASLN